MSEPHGLPLLVIGAGIAGVTAALEAAEAGAHVLLVEREPWIGGRVLRSHRYFPKMCPPSCGMEVNVRRLERNPRVRVLTATRVTAATPSAAGWTVSLGTEAAFVNARCTACGKCEKACATEVPDPFNLGLARVKAIRLPHLNAWPQRHVFDRAACPDDEAQRIAAACPYGAVELQAAATTQQVEVGAVVVATGWQPYPLAKLAELGGGKLPDVIANVHLERLVAPTGPTGGKILCPSTGRPPRTVAFVQCAGSRDVNHLPYCSGVCCLASLKQALYVREQLPETEVAVYYVDRRTPGRNEDLLLKVAATEGVRLVKGKVGKVEQGEGSLTLRVEDVASGTLLEERADLVVLATGMVPNAATEELPLFAPRDADGFTLGDPAARVTVAGVARRPEDVAASVRDATGAAARALAAARRGA
jgi:quinone-modifying oxidoreductase, subunit QmoA